MSVRGISRRRFVAATSCAAAGIYISPAFGLAKAKPAKPANAYLMDLSRSKYAKLCPFSIERRQDRAGLLGNAGGDQPERVPPGGL